MATKQSDIALFRRLLRQAWPHRLLIAAVFVLDLLATPLALLNPVPLAIAVDSALGNEPLPGILGSLIGTSRPSSQMILILAAVLLVAIALLSQLQSLGSSLLRTLAGERMTLDFRSRLFRHVQRLSLSRHDSHGTTDSLYRIQYDTPAVQYVAIDGVIPFVTASITFLSMLYVILRIDWQLGLVAVAVSPVLSWITQLYRRNLRVQSREVKRIESRALTVVQEVLISLRVVKAFGQEDREQERFVSRSTEGLRARVRYSVAEGRLGLFLGATMAVGTAAVLGIGVLHVQSELLSLGSLLLVMGYLSQLYSPLRTISRKVARLQTHLASAERAFALLDEMPDVQERDGARPLTRAAGRVVFQDVTFSYNGAQPVLSHVSFDVAPGTRVGIAGRTGAGKTTLVSLLTRFYDPSQGRILLDDVDLRDYRLADLRDQFAIVLQEPALFSTSIAENIAYARPGASRAEIMRTTEAANAHDFIVNLPEGYDSLVGERGLLLSGGERQRIALARAFLKDAPILIMDEPTSSVDIKTESGIMDAMERLMRGRTTFLIAHRLTTLEGCDLLLVLKEGRLVEVTSEVRATVKQALELGDMEAAVQER